MISVNSIGVEFSGETLFSDVNFVINENDKIALMGKNGAGKSTMMKIIAGVLKANKGSVQVPKDAVIAYLPQHLLTEDDCTVFEETSKAFGTIFQMRDEINKLNKDLKIMKEDYAKMIVKSYKSRSEQSRFMFVLSSRKPTTLPSISTILIRMVFSLKG